MTRIGSRDGATTVAVVAALAFCCVVVTLIGPRLIPVGTVSPLTNPVDFRAFYCAGRVLMSGKDPYLVEPLRTCEEAATQRMGLTMVKALVVPAPLPPYALLAFGLFALLPFANAVSLWFFLLLLATLGVVIMLRKMTGVPPVLITVVWMISIAPSALLGQVVPIVTLLMVGGAYLIRHERFVLAGVCAAGTMVEPYLGFTVLPRSLHFCFAHAHNAYG